MAITPRQYLNYNFKKIILGIIIIFFFFIFMFGCKGEWNPLEGMNCNPCIVIGIDSSDVKEPILTVIDSAGKIRRIISLEFSIIHPVGDSIWEKNTK